MFARRSAQRLLNDAGQVAFYASLTGPDSRGQNDFGLFGTDPGGMLHLIARYGDQFEIFPGVFRTISAVSFDGVNGSHQLDITSDGTVPLFLRFTDNSEAIYLARVIPEPVVFPAGVAVCILRRRVR